MTKAEGREARLALLNQPPSVEVFRALCAHFPDGDIADEELQDLLARLALWPEDIERRVPPFWFPRPDWPVACLLCNHLDLFARGTTTADARKLAESPHLAHLRSIELSRNYLELKVCRALAEARHLTALRRLRLEHAHLKVQGLKVLCESPLARALQDIDVSQNQLGPKGVEVLVSAEHLHGLRHLNLSKNKLGPKGAKILAESSPWDHLESLDLIGNGIEGRGAADVLSSPRCASLTRLKLAYNGIEGSGAVEALSGATLPLRHLELDGNTLGVEGTRSLASNPVFRGLETLTLLADDEALEALCDAPQFEHLRTLTLRTPKDDPLTAWGAGALGKCAAFSHVESLSIRSICTLGAEGVRALTANTALMSGLRALTLWHCGVEDDGAQLLAGCEALGQLEKLDLWANNIGVSGARALLSSPHLSQLRDLDIGANEIKDAAEHIFEEVRLVHLERLNLRYNRMRSPAPAQALAACEALSSLRHLNLDDCEISPEGVRAITTSSNMSGLHMLECSGNELDEAGVISAFGPDCTLTELRELRLFSAGIGPEGAQVLADAGFSKLETLALSCNPLKPAGARALANSPHMQNLTTLLLHQCALGNNGAIALADSPYLPSLEMLDVHDNALGEKAWRAFIGSAQLMWLRGIHLDGAHNMNRKNRDKLVRDWHRWTKQRGIRINFYI
ncbi:MAG: hypothetical protein ACE366_14190 [Bradymonadia bacterium]